MKKLQHLVYSLFCVMFLMACGKNFLELRYDASVLTPTRIEDYQAMLDNSTGMMTSNSAHVLSLIAGEEFHIASADWHGVPTTRDRKQEKNAYIWAQDIYENEPGGDWNGAYARILQTNLVLDGLKNMPAGQQGTMAYNKVKGSALFFRALNHYQLAQLFCRPFDGNSAATDMGLPLRLEADVTLKTGRASLAETYNQIIDDLVGAAELLPDMPEYKMRPSKAAVYALLAKTYLQMGEYSTAGEYADRSLSIHGALIDYNTLSFENSYTFPYDYGESNKEVVFFCYAPNVAVMNRTRMDLNIELLDMYAEGDLREKAFFAEGDEGNIFFKGSYFGNSPYFTGISTSEVQLIKAECYARTGREPLANEALRRLLIHRYKKGAILPGDTSDILKAIVDERRRELPFRGIRWEDLRRLSGDDRFATIMTRQIDDTLYELAPGDSKWVFPIPQNVIDIGGIPQNER